MYKPHLSMYEKIINFKMKRDSHAFNMKPSLNFVDDLEDPADDYYLEDFIKGFEILKLRIDKLRTYSNDLD